MKEDFQILWDYSEFFKGLDAIEGKLLAKLHQAAILVILDMKAKAVERCPVLTGFLRGQHVVDVDQNNERTIMVIGANAFYAASRHENPAAGTHGGEGFWLTKTLREGGEGWMKFIAERLKS